MHEEQVNSIDLKELLSLLLKNIVFIGIVTFGIAIIVGLYTFNFVPKKYESKTLINVTKDIDEEANSTSSDIFRYGSELAKRYSIIAKSNTVLEMVKTDLKTNHNLNIKKQQLIDSFEVISVNETDILRITVTYTDYILAKDIAQAITDASMIVYENTYQDASVTSIDEADLNDIPVSPNLKLNVVIGFVLGLMLSVGSVLMKEFLNRKIKTEKDIEQYLEIPYFGSIPNYKKLKNL